ncbi:MAG TPA: hypothetical protein VJT49_11915 [Amycolatopsis sp.]|uniref:hypothetical protein n=1 Tax=Amycolatopsis sp. TaxID=37632 RepID=UPI002B468C7D|nr:hypothetical protein [Amycolatopsis sp.]HKS45794.1 hypothetical protein [Amycolatopsis sp.]
MTGAVRRAQILGATIDTIAEYGYARASFERIRDNRARVDRSTAERAGRAGDRRAVLRAYLDAEVAFLRTHPKAVRTPRNKIARNTAGDPITEALFTHLQVGSRADTRQRGKNCLLKDGV